MKDGVAQDDVDAIGVSIVVITSIVVAATAAAISSKFETFSRVGGIIGTAVSAWVLLLLAVANLYILWRLVKQLRRYMTTPQDEVEGQASVVKGYGCMLGLLRRLFNLIDRWVSQFCLIEYGRGAHKGVGLGRCIR